MSTMIVESTQEALLIFSEKKDIEINQILESYRSDLSKDIDKNCSKVATESQNKLN